MKLKFIQSSQSYKTQAEKGTTYQAGASGYKIHCPANYKVIFFFFYYIYAEKHGELLTELTLLNTPINDSLARKTFVRN